MKYRVEIIKFLSGEEIIATILTETDNTIEIKDALAIGFEPSPQGMKFGFAPFSPLAEDPKVIQKQSVQHISKPMENLLQAYNKVTGNIVVPTQSLVIPQ